MKRMHDGRERSVSLALLAAVAAAVWALGAGTAHAAAYVYVAADAAGANSGANWVDAYTNIQTAVDNSASDDTIVIKQGTYSITNQISVTNGTRTIRGGYAGSGAPGSYAADPALTVIVRATISTNRILSLANCGGVVEGLTLTNGYLSAGNGGGLYLDNVTATITNCALRGNRAADYGGGVYAVGGTPLLVNVVLRGNTAAAWYGGGAHGENSVLELRHCVIRDNYALYWGGALAGKGTGSTRLFNCLVAYNGCTDNGRRNGIRFDNSGGAQVINCTVVANEGWSIYDVRGNTVVSNSVLWANAVDLYNVASNRIFNSCIEDALPGTGVIHDDPKFTYGFYLATNSPCLDRGAGTAAALGLDGRYAAPNAADTGTVDMGYHFPAGHTPNPADLYVSVNGGADGNAGDSWGAALKTLTNALARAVLGTRIYVASGLYTTNTEAFPLAVNTDEVQILGTNAAATVLDASGSGKQVMTVSGVGPGGRLEGLTLKGGSNAQGGGLALSNTALIVATCTISSNQSSGNYGGGVYVARGSPIFSNCVIRANTNGYRGGGLAIERGRVTCRQCVFANNVSVYQGGGLYSFYGRADLRNCLIASNTATFNSTTTTGGVGLDNSNESTGPYSMENCTVAYNGPANVIGVRNGGAGTDGGGAFTIRNCIVWGHGDDLRGISTNSLAYSCIEDGDNNGTNGCTNANPMFADTTYYHLQSKGGNYVDGYFSGGSWASGSVMSPLIDAGDPAADWSREPNYPRGYLEMGAYGNTPVASKGPPPSGTMIIIR